MAVSRKNGYISATYEKFIHMNYHKKQVMSRYDEDCARPAHVLWKGKNYVCWPQALQARYAEETAWNKTRPGKNSQATKSQHSRVRNSKQTTISHTFFANKFQVNAKDRQINQKNKKSKRFMECNKGEATTSLKKRMVEDSKNRAKVCYAVRWKKTSQLYASAQ